MFSFCVVELLLFIYLFHFLSILVYEVSYLFLASNPNGNYLIDEKSGKISVNGLIDREVSGSLFYLTVQVGNVPV